MKKEIKVVAIVLAALIIFLSGFGIGATKGINVNVNYAGGEAPVNNTTAPTTAATTAPTTAATTAPTTAASNDAPATETSKPVADAPAGDSKVPASPAEVVAAYNKVVNEAKNFKGAVHFKKDSVVAIGITDCPGGDTVRNILEPVINKLAGGSTTEADFNNGEATIDGEVKTLYSRITPGDRDTALTEAACESATAVADGDGYKMSIKIKAEQSTFDGTNTVYPVNNQSFTDPLNLATLDLGSIKITNATMNYPGTTLEVKVDGQGRLTELGLKMPIDGKGTGGMGFINAEVGIAGSLEDLYTLTYA